MHKRLSLEFGVLLNIDFRFDIGCLPSDILEVDSLKQVTFVDIGANYYFVLGSVEEFG